jgi:hypothetical protein
MMSIASAVELLSLVGLGVALAALRWQGGQASLQPLELVREVLRW